MMFQGSENIGRTGHFTFINEAGGKLNGSTTQDRTNYYETIASNNLELLLWLESDRMQFLNINQENFDNQREVVKEEMRERYDNRPYGKWFYHIFKHAYKYTPYEWITIGDIEHLNNSSLSDAKLFYQKHYGPDNAVLVLSGDFDSEAAKTLIQKYFGELKPIGISKNHTNFFKPLKTEKRLKVTDNIQLPAIYIAYKIPALTSEDIYALHLLSYILSYGKSSRLYNKLVYAEKLAKSVTAQVWDLEAGGLFIITVYGFKDSKLNELKTAIDKELGNLFSTPITDKELQKVKNSIETYLESSMQTNSIIAEHLAFYWTYFKNTALINKQSKLYNAVTQENISSVIKKYLTKNNRIVLNYLPKNEL